LLIAFWLLFRTDSPLVSVGFYLYGLIIGILLISQFWTLANDIYDPRQAKRLFGFIGGGASLGGMTGAGLTALLVDTVGTQDLLLGSATVLAACMLVVSTIIRDPEEQMWVRRHIPATLAHIPSQRSIEILIGALQEKDGFLRYKAVTALEKLRREHPELSVDRGPVEELALKEALRY